MAIVPELWKSSEVEDATWEMRKRPTLLLIYRRSDFGSSRWEASINTANVLARFFLTLFYSVVLHERDLKSMAKICECSAYGILDTDW